MREIWKYALDPKQPMAKMPTGAQVLCAAAQGDNVCIWAEVNPSIVEKEARWFDVYGTGHTIEDEGVNPRRYIGTAFLHGGALVFHVFERINGRRAQ